MDKDIIFSFSYGDFFYGYKVIEVYKDINGIHAAIASTLYPEKAKLISVSKEKLKALEGALSAAGVEDWFCYYIDHGIDDGTQWVMVYEGIEYSGLNCYPKGFRDVLAYLAKHFKRKDLNPEDGLYPDHECDPISHIAEHEPYMEDEESIRVRVEKRHDNPANVERSIRQASQNLIHDLNLLVRKDKRFTCYQEILEDAGIKLDINSIIETGASSLDVDVIIAMMIYVARYDYHSGYSDVFATCVSNGTFKVWLSRISDLLLQRFIETFAQQHCG